MRLTATLCLTIAVLLGSIGCVRTHETWFGDVEPALTTYHL